MKEVAIIIPARLNSTRLPMKMLADINGMSMIARVYLAAKQAEFADVIVACDSRQIQEEIEDIGGTAIITEPDISTGTDRIFAAIEKLQTNYKYIINLQGDIPSVNKNHFEKLLELLKQDSNDIATLAFKITDPSEIDNPNVVKIAATKKPDGTYKAHYFSRLPIPFNAPCKFHHVGIYGFKVDALKNFVKLSPTELEISEKLEQLRALEHGMNIEFSLIEEEIFGVDTAEDLEKARAILV